MASEEKGGTALEDSLPYAPMACGQPWSASAITARQAMKRDLYLEVSARIVAELEAGAAPWVKPWSATPVRIPRAMP